MSSIDEGRAGGGSHLRPADHYLDSAGCTDSPIVAEHADGC
ncbi:MAG TPA: hypothetical protein VKF14_19000 [Candidatus Dormibacteraeota bacterium]|nr:hypothetical protein [Candidatus Dormibacteraeota bacterium]